MTNVIIDNLPSIFGIKEAFQTLVVMSRVVREFTVHITCGFTQRQIALRTCVLLNLKPQEEECIFEEFTVDSRNWV